MKLWRRRQHDRAPEAEATEPDRRTPAWRCANCQRKGGPFIYFENGRHYRESCAGAVSRHIGISTGGRRHDDITHVPPPAE